MGIKGKLDGAGLVAALGQLGVRPTCHVMVHASLSTLGVVEGGAATAVDALREAAGAEGAVVVPSFRDAIRADYYAMRECSDGCPRELCPSREPGYTGVIGETVRGRPDSLRNCHPTHSWVGVGGGAEFLLAGHRNRPTPCGNDSPFFRLMQRDGVVLLLGVGLNAMTNLHAVEDARNVPYLSAIDPPRRHATYTTSGKRIQYAYPELLHAAFLEAGIMTPGRIGAGTSYIMSARALGSFLWVITEDDPWCLVLRPRAGRYDPFGDACAKVSGMASAWRANPNCEAWRMLLERSHGTADPAPFEPAERPAVDCPAYRGVVRDHHRCAANDLPPWEKFDDYPRQPGVATCNRCNWPAEHRANQRASSSSR